MILELIPTDKLGFLSKNYYLRSFLCFATIVPSMLQAPTTTGGLCMFFAGLTYLKAAWNGENGDIVVGKRR